MAERFSHAVVPAEAEASVNPGCNWEAREQPGWNGAWGKGR